MSVEMIAQNAVQLSLNGDISQDTSNGNGNGKLPYPFVKWAGGKRFLIKELISNLPDQFGDYYEPFVGGGALFFSIYKQIKTAYLSDKNMDLIYTYKVIQKDPYKLIEILKLYARQNSKEFYLSTRESEPKDTIERAARLIYLNRTCYNGLYRENKKGKFNVPYGSYKNPNIIQETNILACHEALKGVNISYQDFRKIRPKSGDFVYFDPPYHPTDEISFTEYTKKNFTEKDQEDLRDFARALHKRGVKILLSNSNTPYIRDKYDREPFSVIVVKAPRFVNCKADRRNPVEEVLITTY